MKSISGKRMAAMNKIKRRINNAVRDAQLAANPAQQNVAEAEGMKAAHALGHLTAAIKAQK